MKDMSVTGTLIQTQCRRLSYFHDRFRSTDEVARFIKREAKGRPGSFLLRPSNRNPDRLTASVLVPDGSVRHTHIMIEQNESNGGYRYFLVVEKKFDSIDRLVSFYKTNPVKNLENVNNVYLQNPICHNNAVPPEFLPGSARPPLPPRPSTSLDRTNSSSGSSISFSPSRGSLQDIERRPPCPLPVEPTYNRCDYSRPRDIEEDISEQLMTTLRLSEKCECGIPRTLAELPNGWTVHQSREPATRGKLFFQCPEERTYWQLPVQVEMLLTAAHRRNLETIDRNFCLRQNGSASVSSNGINKM